MLNFLILIKSSLMANDVEPLEVIFKFNSLNDDYLSFINALGN